jgi:CheY-like chemotaxis protein
MLSEMVALLRRTLGETVLVEINAANELPSLHADRAQLESALLNLALNARDAMPRGGELRIEARVTEVADAEAARLDIQPGRFLSLIMVDTGFGMSPETLEHAFEPFFTTKSPSEGNGLGLSMVYGFVRQSGGQVCVESQLGYGTRFELMLPLQERPAEAPSDAAPATPADGVPGGSEWILVVEDDPAVRRVTLAFLRSLGYRVDEVPSAELAIDFVAQAAGLALVLSDVVLGNGRSGVELAQELATLRPGLPVLLTSGYEHQTLQQLGIMTGQFELLRKPYRREQLALMLRRKLDSASV